MVATYEGVLEGTELAEAMQRLPHVAHIRADMLIKGTNSSRSSGLHADYAGKSGATIIYAYVTPDSKAHWPQGFYYIKVSQPEADPTVNQERARRMEALLNRHQSGTVALITFAIHHQYLVEMTASAFATAASDHQIRPLTYLLKYRTHMAQCYLRGVTEILLKWVDEEVHEEPRVLENIFQLMFEGETLRDLGKGSTRSIAHRARMMFKQLRRRINDEDVPLEIDEYRLLNALYIDFSGVRLPNPIAYVNDSRRWEGSDRIPYPSTFSHYDLHCDNVICDTRPADMTAKTLQPDIIDLTDHKQRFPLFWDFLYLEFDLLLRAGQPENPDNRRELMNLIASLMPSDIEDALPYDGPPRFQSIYESVKILRDGLYSFLQKKPLDVRRKYKRAFWTVATGVGLNYMRKSSIDVQGRLLGLFYAASAFARVLEGEGISPDQAVGDAFIIPEWSTLSKQPQTDSLLQYFDQSFDPTIKADIPVIICLSPRMNPLLDDDLREQINERLRWWLPAEDEQLPPTLAQAQQRFRETTSDLNLTTLVRRRTQDALDDRPLLASLKALTERLPHVTLVTTSWYDPLLPCPDPTDIAPDRSVIYLCGHADNDDSLQMLATLDSNATLPQFIRDEHAYLRELVSQPHARVIFLGSHPDYPIWQQLFGQVDHVDYFDRSAPNFQLGKNFTAYLHPPETFVDQLNQYYDRQPVITRPRIHQPLERCKPPPVNQQDLQEDILYHRQRRLWMIHDVPWRGKSTFLQMLTQKYYRQQPASHPVRNYLLLDFARHPNLRAERRAVIALLLDHFRVAYPSYLKYIERRDAEKLALLRDALFDAPALNQPHPDYMIAIDGLHHDDPYVLEWLRDEIAPELARRGVTVVFALRTYTPLADVDPVPLNYARWRANYEIRSLAPLRVRDIKQLIKTYVENVRWQQGQRPHLMAKIEYWSYEQALLYQQIGRDNLMVVDRIFRYHLQSANGSRPHLGTWPTPEERPLIEQVTVHDTLWQNIRRELRLDALKESMRESLRRHEDDQITSIVGDYNPLEDFYRDILTCRRLTTEFVEQWRDARLRLPKFMPTIITELQSLAYIRYDDRARDLTLEQRQKFPPTYFVLEMIYTTLQRALYHQELEQQAAPDVKSTTFYNIAYNNYLKAAHLADLAEAERLEPIFIANAADALYYGVLLDLINQAQTPPQVDLRNYLVKMRALGIPLEKLYQELQTINIDWQIDEVQPRLRGLIDRIPV